MYYNKKLYSPDPYISGGGEEGSRGEGESEGDGRDYGDGRSGSGGGGVYPPVIGWEWDGAEWKRADIIIDKATWDPSIDDNWEWNIETETWDWEGEELVTKHGGGKEKPPVKPEKPKRPPKPKEPPKPFTKSDLRILESRKATTNEIISKISDNKNFKFIEPSGETRTITIKGTRKTKFSLTIKDSSDCDILKNKIEWAEIPKSGKYVFQQEYPSILVNSSAVKTKETYTIKVTPSANTGQNFQPIILTQTANPVVTITKTTSQTGPALTVSGSDATITGRANSTIEHNPAKTYTLTITGSNTGTAESLYVKNTKFDKNVASGDLIKKIIDRCGDTGYVNEISLKPLTTRTTSTIEGGNTISGDLAKNMTLYAKVEYTKVVKANLDEDKNALDYNKCKTHTDKFELDNTNDLTLGMSVMSDDIKPGTYISSIDCDKNITLLPKQIIKTDATLTFKQEWWSTVVEVVSNVDSKGNAYIKLSNSIDIPDATEIQFYEVGNGIGAVNRILNSGSDSISLTTYIYTTTFGGKDVTYTLDLDEMITSKPNAYNQDVIVAKNSKSNTIKMIKHDRDLNASSKTGSVVGGPKNGSISSYATSTDSFNYVPNNEFTGEDFFTFTMSDSVNVSNEKTIRITVK